MFLGRSRSNRRESAAKSMCGLDRIWGKAISGYQFG
jgi:hypothetical protein